MMRDLTPKQAAEQLGCSRDTVINWILAGEFPGAYNVGGAGTGTRYRIGQADVDRFKQARRVSAA